MRNTKQMNIIEDILKNDKSHPTIQEIYQKVKLVDDSIGQATIYRNVNKLVNLGKVLRLPAVNDIYHYDGNPAPHDHMLCTKCHKIYDFFENDYEELINNVESNYHVKISKVNILYEGICNDCLRKN